MNKDQDIQISELLLLPDSKNAAISKHVQQLLDLVEAFVSVIDSSGNITLMNRKGKELLDCLDEEVKGKNLIEHFVAKEHQGKMSDLLEDILRGNAQESVYHEIRFCAKKNEIRVLEIKSTPITARHNKILGIVISGSDITKKKLSTRNLYRSKEKAEHLNRAKSEFLARVSHEIRTPLNAIMGFSEQLMQTRLDNQQKEFLKIIDKSSEHMLSLINDILVIQKIEAKELDFEKTPFKIRYPIEYIYNALQAKAKEKKLRFTYHIDERLIDMVLIGDAFRLRQILINMLSNAIKFTHQGYVELKCFIKSSSEDDIKVRFDIIDTGIGISPDNIDSIFDEFKQADSSITKKYGGTGLGLTICKNLIEMQNGSLSVASQEGNGTTFTFSIPYKKGTETDIAPADYGTVDSKKLKNKKVLLVDDDSVNRLLGKTILEKFKCLFDIANSGEEAIERLKRSKYDIVLLDIHMPDINGLDVAKYLRKTTGGESTKIIAVTAAFMQHDVKEFYENGINDFLIKPFKELTLFNKMCDALEIKIRTESRQKTEIILEEYQNPKSYNLAELEKMAGNDKNFVTQMLLTFIGNTETTIHILPQLLREKNWEQIGETAHKILPSYRHLEIEDIVSKLLEIKTKTLIKPDYKAVPALVRTTMEDMKQLIEELKREMIE